MKKNIIAGMFMGMLVLSSPLMAGTTKSTSALQKDLDALTTQVNGQVKDVYAAIQKVQAQMNTMNQDIQKQLAALTNTMNQQVQAASEASQKQLASFSKSIQAQTAQLNKEIDALKKKVK